MADRRRQRASQDSSEEDESDSQPGSAGSSPRSGSHRLGLAGPAITAGATAGTENVEAPVTVGGSPADSECVSGKFRKGKRERESSYGRLPAFLCIL